MYYCNNCKNIVEDLDGTGEFFKGREHGACPRCHSEDLEEAWKCGICGTAVKPDEVICPHCMTELADAWNEAVEKIAKNHGIEFKKAERAIIDFMEGEVF